MTHMTKHQSKQCWNTCTRSSKGQVEVIHCNLQAHTHLGAMPQIYLSNRTTQRCFNVHRKPNEQVLNKKNHISKCSARRSYFIYTGNAEHCPASFTLLSNLQSSDFGFLSIQSLVKNGGSGTSHAAAPSTRFFLIWSRFSM